MVAVCLNLHPLFGVVRCRLKVAYAAPNFAVTSRLQQQSYENLTEDAKITLKNY